MNAVNVMCPQCGILFQPCHLIPLHTETGATCAGVGQIARCAESDRQPLWNGARNPHQPRVEQGHPRRDAMTTQRLRAPLPIDRIRNEAARSVEAISERHFTPEALERQIKTFAGYIYDLTDERVFLDRVAHAAYHLIDDGGESEVEKPDDHGLPIHIYFHSDHVRLSDALDAAEANGWDAHPESEDAREVV